jgi:hypothetical protein
MKVPIQGLNQSVLVCASATNQYNVTGTFLSLNHVLGLILKVSSIIILIVEMQKNAEWDKSIRILIRRRAFSLQKHVIERNQKNRFEIINKSISRNIS